MNLETMLEKQPKQPPRILIYAGPGWGKSTLAASMPSPVFINVDDGLPNDEIPSFPVPKSLDDVFDSLQHLTDNEHSFKTVVIDTLSSLEKLIFARVCEEKDKTSIEDIGYAKGYTFAMTWWNAFFHSLETLRAKNIAPVLLAHAETKIHTSPILEPYDRFTIMLHRLPLNRILQWCDLILFGTMRAFVTKKEEGFRSYREAIGQGERIIYTQERPAFIAKTRGMKLPLEIEIPEENGWDAIRRHIISPKKGDE